MIIKNFKTLAKTSFRKKALQIVEAGYNAININSVIQSKIKYQKSKNSEFLKVNDWDFDILKYKNIFIIGIGKGSALASMALAKILGSRLSKGIAVDVEKPKLEIKNSKLEILTGTHPIPSAQNIKATKKIIELAKSASKDDLIISFICGGGSALLCGSQKELKGSREIFSKLTNAGANIIELNTIRKHLSKVKGGGLAKIAYPATMISLIVSDIFSGDLSMVASGPTIPDKTTEKDAEKILKKYGLLSSATRNLLIETPKANFRSEQSYAMGDKKYFKKVKNVLFVSNREPIMAMAEKAKELGIKTKIYSYNLKGEAKNVFTPLISLLSYRKAKEETVVFAGGETTIKLGKNPGKGGRNMEVVLGAISNLKSLPCRQASKISNLIVVSFASDGRDNTDAAGAIGDILTINKAEKLGLDIKKYLEKHDTLKFFKKTEDLIFTDNRNFNVSDLMLALSSVKR